MLSITTDYVKDVGCPEPYLKRIAEAGFSHVHWCHHWRTDFVYSDCEIEQIARWLQDFGLKLNDLHASAGVEKAWVSSLEYERLAGVELVKNRISMTARLSSDVIVMHIPSEPEDAGERNVFWTQVLKSLDAIEPYARDHGVRIAIENLGPDSFKTIERILSQYSPDYIGLCYDSGHGNLGICSGGLDQLERLKERLISMHLNDNDGTADQHNPLFSGTVEWARLARIVAESSYAKCINMEITIHHSGIEDESAFLEKAFETGMVFSHMVDESVEVERGEQ
ncbi:MAG: sugar phosphate isomerase/epimerase [Anaerolineae bacterium]|nr:sugar phosphate isomerase/epimerase [Anaerolineae bacterium]